MSVELQKILYSIFGQGHWIGKKKYIEIRFSRNEYIITEFWSRFFSSSSIYYAHTVGQLDMANMWSE